MGLKTNTGERSNEQDGISPTTRLTRSSREQGTSSGQSSTTDIAIGDHVIAKWPEDRRWYAAIVKNKTNRRLVACMFIVTVVMVE